MRSERADTNSSVNGGHNKRRLLKAYRAPKFKILTAQQAEARLKGKALPGDAGARGPRSS